MKKVILTLLTVVITISIISQSTYAQKTGTFTDNRDGKEYKTVKIGNQVWLAENLAYYTDNGCWAYKDKPSNVSKYGYLYNWETAKNVCPDGWRLPTKSDFETLLDNSGGRSNHTDLKVYFKNVS